jgi:hypothetical protein
VQRDENQKAPSRRSSVINGSPLSGTLHNTCASPPSDSDRCLKVLYRVTKKSKRTTSSWTSGCRQCNKKSSEGGSRSIFSEKWCRVSLLRAKVERLIRNVGSESYVNTPILGADEARNNGSTIVYPHFDVA